MKRDMDEEWNLIGDDLFDLWEGLDEDDLGNPDGHIEQIDDIMRHRYGDMLGELDMDSDKLN